MPNLFLSIWTVLFHPIQFSISTLLSISTLFSPVYPIDRTLSGATTPVQSGPASDGNEGILRIPQSSSIIGASPWDCLVSYTGHSLRESYPSTEMYSVYFLAPADWARKQKKRLTNYIFNLVFVRLSGVYPLSQCLRNFPTSQVQFGRVTRWTGESASFTNRTLSWVDSAASTRSLPT